MALTAADVEAVLAKRLPKYDKGGQEHFNIISALHKAVRGSDVEGALYWLGRMLVGGEDPLYVARPPCVGPGGTSRRTAGIGEKKIAERLAWWAERRGRGR